MSGYQDFRDAADVFAACYPRAKDFDGDCAAANRPYPVIEKIKERAIAEALADKEESPQPDPRDATIRELRELCGEAAVQLDKSLDLAGLFYQYERSEHICSVIGDEALAAKLRAASEGKKL
jgi:hypothetical protein